MANETPAGFFGVSDRELVEQVRQASTAKARTEALNEIATRHFRDVLRYLAHRTGDADVAQELTQQTFTDAIAVLVSDDAHGSRPEQPEKLGAWLIGVAKRRLLNHAAQQKRQRARSRVLGKDETLDDHPDGDPDRPDAADDPARMMAALRTVEEVAQTLAPDDAELYRWYFQDGLEPRAIAARLAKTPSTAAPGKGGATAHSWRADPTPKTVSNRVTAVKTVLAEGFHAYLLTQGDRTVCPLLGTIVDQHPGRFSAALRDHVVKHTRNCAQCGSCARCPCRIRDAAMITSCVKSRTCSNCPVCYREHLALRAAWAPALVLALYSRPVREAISEAISQAPAPAAEHHDTPDGGRPPRRARSRSGRRLAAAGAAAAVVLTAGGVYLSQLFSGGDSPGPVFHPVAWTTDSSVKVLLDPEKPVRTLATADGANRPDAVVWSADRKRIAWSLQPRAGGSAGGVVHLLDLDSGSEHSWPCEVCAIAFLGNRLVSEGADLTVHPADGGSPTQLDIPGIPPGLAHDGFPNSTPFNVRRTDGSLATYVSVTEEAGSGDAPGAPLGNTGLYEVTPGLEARRLAGGKYNLDRESQGFTSVSPDGRRALLSLSHFGGGTFSTCGLSSDVRAVDLSTGKATEPATEPAFGLTDSASWFDSDGTAHATFEKWDWKGNPPSCERNTAAGPVGYRLPADGTTWAEGDGPAVRSVDTGGTARITSEGFGSTAGQLVLENTQDGGSRKTLDDKAVGIYPSS